MTKLLNARPPAVGGSLSREDLLHGVVALTPTVGYVIRRLVSKLRHFH